MRMNNRTDTFKYSRPELRRSYIDVSEYCQSGWYSDRAEEFATKYLARFYAGNDIAPPDYRTVYKIVHSSPPPKVEILF